MGPFISHPILPRTLSFNSMSSRLEPAHFIGQNVDPFRITLNQRVGVRATRLEDFLR